MAPASMAEEIAGYATVPTEAALSTAIHTIECQPDLPLSQQRAFDREWQRLAPVLQSVCPEWNPPPSGYFSVVRAPFQDLLETHDLLAVPASVFGSPREDLSIVTCLHDLISAAFP
jgi:hypothetical protein